MEIREITLTTPAEWADFIAKNRDEFDGAAEIALALHQARNGGFEMGGGATPLTVIYYMDATIQAKIANDWLVAAAPDMLAALEHLLAVDVASEAGRYRDDRTQAQVAARAAIAKAKGVS